ncbi:MAG: PAS domain S-box protein [Acidobacteriota bacterium]|nr:PAS domain S-box protein [Acidobacteriota bacterium]
MLSPSVTSILAAISDGIVISDLAGNIAAMNPAALALFGVETAEGIHRRDMTLYRPDGAIIPEDEWPLARTRRGEAISGLEALVRRADPPLALYASFSGNLIHSADGEAQAAILTIRDIGETKRHKRELRTLEDRSLLACEAAGMGPWRRNLVNGEVYFSPRCREQFGFGPDELIVSSMIYGAVHEEDRERIIQAVHDAIRSRSDYAAEYRIRRTDGAERWIAVKGRATYDEAGNPLLFQGVSADVTDRRKAEEEFRSMQRQLHHAQKLDSLGVLAGGVAHDFNNLLTGILGNASLALEGLEPNNFRRQMLEEVIRASERAADLTRQLLAYAGKGRFVTCPIQLSQVVMEMNHLIRTSLSKKVHIVQDLDHNLPFIDGDPSQIQQIAMNLVINAAEAIGENQIGTVMVVTRVIHFESLVPGEYFNGEALTPGDYVALEVHDTGTGIDPETKARIFDPFFTTKFTGRGLGLSAVLGIVRSHKGALRVDSERGVGTSFTVLFPVSKEQPEVRAQNPSGTEMIMVVGDCIAEARSLEQFGYPVLMCANLKQASAVLKEGREPVAVVLCSSSDHDPPDLDHAAAVHRIRPGVAVIVSSDLPPVDLMRRLPGQRVSGFVHHSASAAALARSIRQAFRM